MRCGSLFTGIGGFDHAADIMGWETVMQCEINPFAQKILRYYWPKAELFTDITKTDFTKYAGQLDILTGGFPCQPYSVAGKRMGKDDARHLWPHMLRAVRQIRPTWVVGENVRGIVSWNDGLVFDEVQTDLEAEGYEVLPFVLPACGVNAPHRRERVWFVAYANRNTTRTPGTCGEPNSSGSDNHAGQAMRGSGAELNTGCDTFPEIATNANSIGGRREPQSGKPDEFAPQGSKGEPITDTKSERLQSTGNTRNGRTGFADSNSDGFTPDTEGAGLQGRWLSGSTAEQNKITDWRDFPTQSPVCGRNDGVPTGLDGITFPKWRNESIKGYGNAVVPQVVLQIYEAIAKYELLYAGFTD